MRTITQAQKERDYHKKCIKEGWKHRHNVFDRRLVRYHLAALREDRNRFQITSSYGGQTCDDGCTPIAYA